MGMLVDKRSTLSTRATSMLIEHAVAKAEALGIAVQVAVMDASATMCGFLRMQGAHPGSAEVAIDKAWTSVAFGGKATSDLADWLDTVPDTVRQACFARPRFTPLGGALPILLDRELIGSIGVSGGSAHDDESCAAAAIEALTQALRD